MWIQIWWTWADKHTNPYIKIISVLADIKGYGVGNKNKLYGSSIKIYMDDRDEREGKLL